VGSFGLWSLPVAAVAVARTLALLVVAAVVVVWLLSQ
jgi:hypothetical protein